MLMNDFFYVKIEKLPNGTSLSICSVVFHSLTFNASTRFAARTRNGALLQLPPGRKTNSIPIAGSM
jgi:hypothetical protein